MLHVCIWLYSPALQFFFSKYSACVVELVKTFSLFVFVLCFCFVYLHAVIVCLVLTVTVFNP